MKKIIGIACVDANGFYAKSDGGPLPWPNSEGDLDWFKYITNGGILVVGSNTKKELDKLPPLKNREIWAVGKEYKLKSAEDVLERYKKDQTGRNLFICGGAKLWESFENFYTGFYLTVLKQKFIEDGLEISEGMSESLDELDFGLKIIEKEKYSIFFAKI